MKSWHPLALFCALASQSLCAQILEHNALSITPTQAVEEHSIVGIQAISVAKASLKDSQQHGYMGYRQLNISLASLDERLADQSIQTQLSVGIKSSQVMLDSNKDVQYNLFFQGTRRLCFDLPFTLYLQGGLEVDTQARQMCKYSMGSLSLFAQQDFNGHQMSLGLYREFGRHSQLLLPLAGIKTKLTERFGVDVLLPFHAKLTYQAQPELSLFAAVRALKDRQRTQPDHDKRIWEYKATTAALGANYTYSKLAQGSLEIGQAYNSRVRTYNESGRHQEKLQGKNSLFVQAQVNFLF